METHKSLAWQTLKLGLGVITLIILGFITSDIHEMARCLMKLPIDWGVTPPPNCSTNYFGYGLDLKVVVCRGDESSVVNFYQKDTMLRSFSAKETPNMVDWLHRCSGPQIKTPTCPLYETGRPDCPSYNPLTLNDYLCFQDDYLILVINKFRLTKKESDDVIAFLLRER
jgi:hypothetical protein